MYKLKTYNSFYIIKMMNLHKKVVINKNCIPKNLILIFNHLIYIYIKECNFSINKNVNLYIK